MKTKLSNTVPAEKPCRSIDDIVELYGLDPWTIRMWCDRFGITGHVSAAGDLLFSPQAVERIGAIRRMVKKKMTLDDVCKRLESEFGGGGFSGCE